MSQRSRNRLNSKMSRFIGSSGSLVATNSARAAGLLGGVAQAPSMARAAMTRTFGRCRARAVGYNFTEPPNPRSLLVAGVPEGEAWLTMARVNATAFLLTGP